jgi:hypothetical protein
MTDSKITFDQVRAALLGGQFDDSLEAIERVVKSRRASQIRTLKLGDRVTITGNISPQYIKGAHGTVHQVKSSRGRDPYKVTIILEDEHLKQRAARFVDPFTGGIIVPSSCITKVEA